MIQNLRLGRTMALLAGMLSVANAIAVVRDSVTFSNFSPALASSSNVTLGTLRTKVFTVSGYTLGRIDFSGNTTEINGTTADWVNETYFRVVYPGGAPSYSRQVDTFGSYTGTMSFTSSLFLNWGTTAPFGGGTWSFYFVNTADDAPVGLADNVVNITFHLTDELPGAPITVASFNPLPDGLTQNSQTVSSYDAPWFKIVLPSPINRTRFLDIDTEGSFVTSLQTIIALYNDLGYLVASDTSDGSGFLSQLTFGGQFDSRGTFVTGSNLPSMPYDGRDGYLAAGTYYLAVSRPPASFFSTPFGFASFVTGNDTINVRLRTGTVPGNPPATNFGNLPVGVTSQTFSNSANEVKWFKFALDEATSLTRFLDLDMNTSNLDYDFALYNSSGTPLFNIDGLSPSYAPYLSFGGQDNPRSAIPALTRAFAGHSGSLPAGTYYLAVARYALFSGPDFGATTSSSSTGSNLPLRLTVGIVTPPPFPLYVQRLTGINKVASTVGGVSTVFGTVLPPDFSDRQAADDFTITDPLGWTVNLVEGTFIRGFDGTLPTAVNVEIYQKAGSLPGTVISSQTIPWASVTTVDSGLFDSASAALKYRVPISPVNLATGSYFVMIQPVSPNNNLWLEASPDWPAAGSPAVFRRGPSSTGSFDSSLGYPTTWTPTGTPPFSTPLEMTIRLEGSVNTAGNVVGTLDLGQLGGSPYNSGANLPTLLMFAYRDADNNEIVTSTATYDPVTGAVSASIPNEVNQPFRISLKVGFWLRKTMPNPVDPAAPLGNYNFGTVAPAVGDADDDNAVTPSDYGIWQVANGTFPSENTSADFDGDGAVTPSDYGLWQINNGAFGDD